MYKIKIKRFDKSIPLPEYKTKGAAAFDLSSRIDITIKGGQLAYVPLNVAIEVPRGYFLMMAPRSSLHKKGLMKPNSIAVMDSDFRGEGDEYTAVLWNFTKKSVKISKGDRVLQGLLIKIPRVNWQEVSKMKSKTRGGFGSTGHK